MAMSGGFDSSFAAYLLKEKGYNVVGVTFELLGKHAPLIESLYCSHSNHAVARAQGVARYLSIPHYVLDLSQEFETHVIHPFIDEYKSGNTPNPCILCNRSVKFSSFAKKAFSMGADKLATGHYAIIEEIDGDYCLKKGADGYKDQSYFLYSVDKSILKNTLFPLGPYTKKDLRERARNLSWNIHMIEESQDICFIPDNDYGDFLSRHIAPRAGPIYHTDGTFLGNHRGLYFYTIGQRKGINIPYGTPLYVVDIIPDENLIIVGGKEELLCTSLTASKVNMFSHASLNVSGKVRYRQKAEACTYEMEGDSLRVQFATPISSVTPGQSVVLYHGDRVIGGGIIKTRGRQANQ